MTFDDAKQIIIRRLYDEWDNRTVIFLDNEISTPPNEDAYVIFSVRPVTGGQESFGNKGNRKFIRRAKILAKVCTLVDIGTKPGDDLADNLIVIFEAETFSGIMTQNGNHREGYSDGKWRTVIVEIDFFYEQIK